MPETTSDSSSPTALPATAPTDAMLARLYAAILAQAPGPPPPPRACRPPQPHMTVPDNCRRTPLASRRAPRSTTGPVHPQPIDGPPAAPHSAGQPEMP